MDNHDGSYDSMKILQISTIDIGGGAERVAQNLNDGFIHKGIKSVLALGYRKNKNHDSIVMSPQEFTSEDRSIWGRVLWSLLKADPPRFLRKILIRLFHPKKFLFFLLGREFYDFPVSSQILKQIVHHYDIIQCHNLHGHYFDLRILPYLSKKSNLVHTLHDMWIFTGHCAHSFSCERWREGCSKCPNLSSSYPIIRDNAGSNLKIKSQIFVKSKFHIITPSQWLMNKVHQSILKPAIISSKVIPNGVDIEIFKPPENKDEVRKLLGFSRDELIILFTANGICNNQWKDFMTMREAIKMLAHDTCLPIRFIALGDDGPPELLGSARIEFIPYIRDMTLVARYFQSADLYIHAALADTFPNTILEAMACGLPIVATAIGGIPEMILPDRTGILVTPGNARELCKGMEMLVNDESLRIKMGKEGAKRVMEKFTLDQQVEKYLQYYKAIMSTIIIQ